MVVPVVKMVHQVVRERRGKVTRVHLIRVVVNIVLVVVVVRESYSKNPLMRLVFVVKKDFWILWKWKKADRQTQKNHSKSKILFVCFPFELMISCYCLSFFWWWNREAFCWWCGRESPFFCSCCCCFINNLREKRVDHREKKRRRRTWTQAQ